ncbi:hypothetical protein DVH24_019026 [Malus domestica]|uniref:Uncharacterized protein n=1 Tax=Malus domestica TaxID=3750 RepID=A0A498HWZ6_MALDO|nr:hypothetical protein DVH24_019026 [Malus domestica]
MDKSVISLDLQIEKLYNHTYLHRNLRFSIILKNEGTELPTHVVHMLPFNRNLDGMNEKLIAGGKLAKKISLSP